MSPGGIACDELDRVSAVWTATATTRS